ncbi:MAG: hypothetical protein L6R42_006698 [Xanthoria sp. 1 TBL-2021]|nr:MAG: hypothetical protein L6R42_006698 [Xanthoria sp. 1 TBL-2021]
MPQTSVQCVASIWNRIPALQDIYHTELFRRPLAEKGSATAIGPLADLLFRASATAAKVKTSFGSLPFPALIAGQLSIVIINGYKKPNNGPIGKVTPVGYAEERYWLAIVCPKSRDKNEEYHVQTMEAYLQTLSKDLQMPGNAEAAELVQYWNEKMYFFGSDGGEEIQQLLTAAEKDAAENRQGPNWVMKTCAWDHAGK